MRASRNLQGHLDRVSQNEDLPNQSLSPSKINLRVKLQSSRTLIAMSSEVHAGRAKSPSCGPCDDSLRTTKRGLRCVFLRRVGVAKQVLCDDTRCTLRPSAQGNRSGRLHILASRISFLPSTLPSESPLSFAPASCASDTEQCPPETKFRHRQSLEKAIRLHLELQT